MEYTSAGDVMLRYECEGQGDALVLVHELGGSLESWSAVVRAFSGAFRVLRYDQRGAGLSEKVRQPYTIADQVRDLESVLAAAAMPEKLWLAGAAAGATIILAFAVKHPQRLKGIILCAPAVGVDDDRKDYLEKRSKRAAETGMRGVVEESLARSFPKSVIHDRVAYEEYRTRFIANDPIGYGLASRALIEAPFDTTAISLRCPCLILAGEQDSLRPPEAVKQLAAGFSGCELQVLDTGHFMHVQTPLAIAEKIVSFSQAHRGDYVRVRGVCFHCRVDGPPKAPWLVFGNSLATDLSLWDAQVAALSDRYRILRYDQRGHGQTEVSRDIFSFDDLADDVLALLDAFAVKDAVFVGVSMGAITGLKLVSRYPQRFRGVIACDGQPSSPPNAAEAWAARIAMAQTQGMEALVEPTVQRWFMPESIAARLPFVDAVADMIRRTPVEGYIGSATILQQQYDYRKKFAAIHVPVMFLAGKQDGALPEAMRSMHEMTAGSHFALIDRAGHLPNVERPAEVNSAIEDFLAMLPD